MMEASGKEKSSLVIDAYSVRSVAAFINFSCDPNLVKQKLETVSRTTRRSTPPCARAHSLTYTLAAAPGSRMARRASASSPSATSTKATTSALHPDSNPRRALRGESSRRTATGHTAKLTCPSCSQATGATTTRRPCARARASPAHAAPAAASVTSERHTASSPSHPACEERRRTSHE